MDLQHIASTDKTSTDILEEANGSFYNNKNQYAAASSLTEILNPETYEKCPSSNISVPIDYSKHNHLWTSENNDNSKNSEDKNSIELIQTEFVEHQNKNEIRPQPLYQSSVCKNNYKNNESNTARQNDGFFDIENHLDTHSILSRNDNVVIISDTPILSESKISNCTSEIQTQNESRNNLILPLKKRIRDPSMYARKDDDDAKKTKVQSTELKQKQKIEDRGNYIKPPCKCVYKCYNKIDYNERLNASQKYRELSDKKKQLDFLLKYTEKLKKVNCNTHTITHKRIFKFKYKLPLFSKDTEVLVCKKMFMNTLMISNNILKTAWDYFESGKDFKQNKRGRPKIHKKIVVKTMMKSVRDHVNSITPVDSQYSGESISKLYLDGTLSISDMFNLYNEWIDPDKYIRRAETERQYEEYVRKVLEIGNNHSNYNNEHIVTNDCLTSKYCSSSVNENAIENNVGLSNIVEIANDNDNFTPIVPCLEDSKDQFCRKHEQPAEEHQLDTEVIFETHNDYAKNYNHSAPSAVLNRQCIKSCSETIVNEISDIDTNSTVPFKEDVAEKTDNASSNSQANIEKTKIKQLGKPCVCMRKCYEKFAESERKVINEKFRDLEDKQKQSEFILYHTEKHKKKRCVSLKTTNTRIFTFKYKLPNSSGNLLRVCKRMFLNTLMFSDSTIRAAWDKFEQKINDVEQEHTLDKGIGRKIAISMVKSVRDHVNSFVPVEGHFLERQRNVLYLDGSLNISRMFQLYNLWFDSKKYEREVKTEKQYKQIVVKHFKLGFYTPKKDECEKCQNFHKYSKPNDEQIAQHLIHTQHIVTTHDKKNQDELDASTSNGKIITSLFDIEIPLSCPNGPEAHFKNRRKLLCFNLPVLDMITKRPVCYMWDERFAKNGANEVGSCLYSYLNYSIQNGVEEFRFWSENDKTRNIIIFCAYISVAFAKKVNIYHNFHIKDHVQSELTSVYSVIEKISSTKHIFTPEEWKNIVKWTRTNCQETYKVVNMTQDDFYDFGNLMKYFDWEKDSEGKIIIWDDVREVYISSDNYEIKFRYEFSQQYRIINFKKQTEFPNILKAYNEILPLSEAKYKDLIDLCNNGSIPKKYFEYYKLLAHNVI